MRRSRRRWNRLLYPRALRGQHHHDRGPLTVAKDVGVFLRWLQHVLETTEPEEAAEPEKAAEEEEEEAAAPAEEAAAAPEAEEKSTSCSSA